MVNQPDKMHIQIIYGISNTGEKDVRFTREEAAKLAAEAVARALKPAPVHVSPEDIISAARKRNAAKTVKGNALKEKLKPLDKELQEIQRVEAAATVESPADKPRMFSSSPMGSSSQSATPTPALPVSNVTTNDAILKEFQEFLRMKNLSGK